MARSLRNALMAGLAAGLVGTLTMDAYWKAYGTLRPSSGGGEGSSEEPSTVKLARRSLRRVGIKHPSKRTRAIGGQAVHWSYGALWGVVTGLSHWAGAPLDWGGGQLLGAGLWAGGDLFMLYRLGLARHPREYPVESHVSALGAHMAYGLGAWATTKGIEMALSPAPRLKRAA